MSCRHVMIIMALLLHQIAGDTTCFTMYSDRGCKNRRTAVSAGFVDTTLCSDDASFCIGSGDFKESYKLSCYNDTSNFLEVYSGETCQDSPIDTIQNINLTDDPCIPISDFYVKLDCDGLGVDTNTTNSFIAALIIDLSLFIILLLLFELLRKLRPKFYDWRTGHYDGFFGWFKSAYKMTQDDILERAGVDGVMYIEMFTFGMKVFVLALVLGLVICLPVNVTGESGRTGIEATSLSNVPNGSSRLWTITIVSYIIIPFALYLLNKTNHKFVKLRIQRLSMPRPHNFAILIRDIPDRFRSAAGLRSVMSDAFGESSVFSAFVLKNSGKLGGISQERKKVKQHLEKARKIAKENDSRPTVHTHWYKIGSEKVDALHHYGHQLKTLNDKFQEEKHFLELNRDGGLSAGFVVFNDVKTSVMATQLAYSSHPFSWTVDDAPAPNDVFWSNMPHSAYNRMIRSVIITILTILVLLFWAIPVGFAASLTNFENIARAFGIDDLSDADATVEAIVSGFLSSLVLIIFIGILPLIMWYLSQAEGYPSWTAIDRAAFNKLFLFFAINLFLLSLLAGSAFDAVDKIVSNPKDILDFLGQSLPKTGTFFTTYVLFLTTISYPLQLIRIWDWLSVLCCQCCCRFHSFSDPYHFFIGLAAPRELLSLIFGFVFVAVAPVILPFLLFYFVMGYFAARYTLLFSSKQKHFSNGLVWPSIAHNIMLGMVVSIVCLIGTLVVKEAPAPATCLLPLLVGVCIIWYKISQIRKRVMYLPLLNAIELPQTEPTEMVKDYIQPELCEKDALSLDSLDSAHDQPQYGSVQDGDQRKAEEIV